MNTQEYFIRRIRADPDNLQLRLIFADWLEEEGECAKSEYIRVSVELLQIGDVVEPRSCMVPKDFGGMEVSWSGSPREVWNRSQALARRQDQLMKEHPIALAQPVYARTTTDRSFICTFRAGLVESITCTALDWCFLADCLRHEKKSLFAYQPVRKVHLSDRSPADYNQTGPWVEWYKDRSRGQFVLSTFHLPDVLFDLLQAGELRVSRYADGSAGTTMRLCDNRQQAEDDLSQAALRLVDQPIKS